MKFVNLLITQAVQDRASDIHIEPAERELRVRYRIDGVLHEVMHSPKTIAAGVVSRLKIMAEMNIAERRIPQDGRLSVTVNGRKIDLRVVASLPTVWGEKIVMRILDNSTASLNLSDLGFLPSSYERYSASFQKPYGMILVTGPTGSGKSTTLYATLNVISTPGQERHHRRGPGRVPAAGHQPGADELQGRPDLRGCAALDPAVRPRRRAHR